MLDQFGPLISAIVAHPIRTFLICGGAVMGLTAIVSLVLEDRGLLVASRSALIQTGIIAFLGLLAGGLGWYSRRKGLTSVALTWYRIAMWCFVLAVSGAMVYANANYSETVEKKNEEWFQRYERNQGR